MPKPKTPAPLDQAENLTPKQLPKKKNPATPAVQKSAVADFVAHEMPSDEDTEKFENYVHEEIREQEIEEGLSKIYSGDKNGMVDVGKIDKVVRHGIIFRFFRGLLSLAILAGLVYAGYLYVYLKNTDSNSVNFSINSEKETLAGKEITYTVTYRNFDRVDLKDITIDLIYPNNFVYLDAEPKPSKDLNSWKFDSLAVRRSGEIKIKGRLIGEQNSSAIILGSMNYMPGNINSEFKKEASFETHLSGTGLILQVSSNSSSLVNEQSEIVVRYQAENESYLDNFRLSMDLPENLELERLSAGTSSLPGVWQINDISKDAKELKIKFKFKDKLLDSQDINLKFEYSHDGQKYFPFFAQKLTYEVMKRDLNLNLIINGSRSDQGVDFGQNLNYSIVFNNKGRTEMRDVVIMAVLDSDFLDWTTLADKNKGVASNKTVSWSKDELPMLASLSPGTEGTIDFSIKLKPAGEIDVAKKYQVKSFAQFSVGQFATTSISTDADMASTTQTQEINDASKSNVIINKINSDLSLDERVRYFSDDNIAVGSGPLPPKIGESTSYKVYWTLTNNLNELTDVRVETTLPAGVAFDQKNNANLGTLTFDPATNKVTWNIGRLPITAYKSDAEFNISIKPMAADENKILVLLAGSEIIATDNVTGSPINKKLKPKTTKLDDDQVVTDDGRVVR